MKKREFLAMSGAAPLVLAGCGGKGAGDAPVRLVNASVGYPTLGFMVNGTQAASGVTYGSVSAFESVDADSESTSLTLPAGSAVATVTRSYSKSSNYSLVAYGYVGELKQVLITESTNTPDNGYIAINVLNTSIDIGAVDVYLLTDRNDRTTAQQIASNIAASSIGTAQGNALSAFPVGTTSAGLTFYVMVVGVGANPATTADVRLLSTTAITLHNQQTYTIILTPGASGTLANAILLQQGSSGTTVVLNNASARVRAFVSLGSTNTAVSIAGIESTALASPYETSYTVIPQGTPPTVTVGGTVVSSANIIVTGNPTGTAANTLVAGSDYTLLVYLVSGQATAQFILDDNTTPTSSTSIKVRLINLVYDSSGNNASTNLSMSVNGVTVNNSVFATASAYQAVPITTTTPSQIEITSNGTVIKTHVNQQLIQGLTYTDVVLGTTPVVPNGQLDYFVASTTSST